MVIPEITRTVKAAASAIENVGQLSATVSREVEVQSGETTKTQEEVREAIRGVQATMEGVQDAVQTTSETIVRVGDGVDRSVKETAGSLNRVAEQLNVSAQHFSIITANAEQASQSMPAIAKGLEKVAGRAPTYQKIGTILAIGLGLANVLK